MNIYKIILTFLNLRALKKENNAKINVSIHKCNEHNFNVINRNINLGQTESYTLYFIIGGGAASARRTFIVRFTVGVSELLRRAWKRFVRKALLLLYKYINKYKDIYECAVHLQSAGGTFSCMFPWRSYFSGQYTPESGADGERIRRDGGQGSREEEAEQHFTRDLWISVKPATARSSL